MRVARKIATAATVAVLAVAGCSSSSSADGDTIKVGVSPSPHGKILTYVQENLAEDAGLNIEIVEYTDYVEPNKALEAGDIDANWFQHIPYLEESMEANNWDFVHGEGTHLEPLGLFSEKYAAAGEKVEDATIGIINDPTNQSRALTMLAELGFVELPESGEINAATVTPLNGTELVEVEGPALVRNLEDLDYAVINGNFAQEGGLTPADAIALEESSDNPYVNVVAWKKGSDKEEAIKKLDALLHSDEVRSFIEENWADKSVIPAS